MIFLWLHCGVSENPTVSTAVRPPPFFLADSLALDFLNSVASPAGSVIEWISNGEDLVAWLEIAGLIDGRIAAEARGRSLPGELDTVAAEGRALREWFRGFVHAHKGKSLSVEALGELSPLNELLSRDEVYLSIGVRGGPGANGASGKPRLPVFEASRQRRWRNPSSLLLPLAEEMATLVTTADFTHVKKCESEKCTMLIHDTTQRRARRWCRTC